MAALQMFETLTLHEYMGGAVERTKNVFERMNFSKSQNRKLFLNRS